jgi:hypothetical protein
VVSGGGLTRRWGDGGDAEGVFEADGVLDKAGGKRFLKRPELRLGKAGDNDFHFVILHAERAWGGLGFHADHQTFGREAAQAEVLGDVLADTAAESSEEQLGWRHAAVGGAVLSGLVEDYAVLARLGYQARAAGVLQGDIQKANLPIPAKVKASSGPLCEIAESSAFCSFLEGRAMPGMRQVARGWGICAISRRCGGGGAQIH